MTYEEFVKDRKTLNAAVCNSQINNVAQRNDWDWQDTYFDDSWAFLCGPCGSKLTQKLTNNP